VPSITRTSAKGRGARRERIAARLLTVVEGMLEDGENYTELSVERLIKAADLSRSTFYVYFEDKGELLLALAEDVVQQLIVAAQAWWDLEPDAGKAELEDALRGIIDTYGEHATMWAALVDAAAYDPKVRASFRQVVDRTTQEAARHIRDGQAAGVVRPGLDPERTAAWLTWMAERGLYQLVSGADITEIGRLCQAQTDVVWYTLYEGAPNRGAAVG
jgi:AcrR family transcriptional regulator